MPEFLAERCRKIFFVQKRVKEDPLKMGKFCCSLEAPKAALP
jgi:hypothetical protein